MRLDYGDASLLLVARDRLEHSPCMVVTVGLLYEADQTIVTADQAQPWLAERFAKQPFDRGLKKTHGTFAVHGSAYPLNTAQQAGMAVRVNLGSLVKTLHVQPPRQWRKGLLGWSPVVCGALTVFPLDLQHAYGGADSPDNPQGIGYTTEPDVAEGLILPQVESPQTPLRAPGEAVQVASLLPLLPHCRERRTFFGTCDDAWARQRAPFAPLDTDPRWFDEVAQDQVQPGYWAGNEAWSVAGMHPAQLEITGRLPGFRPRLFVQHTLTTGSQAACAPVIEEAKLELDTVWLFPDVERVLLVYRTQIPVRDIDGDDLAAVALRCERATDPGKSPEEWIAELWPQRSGPHGDEQVPPGDAALADEQEEKLSRLSADFEADVAAFIAEHEKNLALSMELTGVADPMGSLQTAQAMERSLTSLMPKLQATLNAAHQLFSDGQDESVPSALRSLGGIQTPADAEAYRAQVEMLAGPEQIEIMLAESEAAIQQQVEDVARLLDRDPQALRAELQASAMPPDPTMAQAQLDTLLGETDLEAMVVELEATLQQQLEQMASDLGMSAQDLLAEAKAHDPLIRFSGLLTDAPLAEGSAEAQQRAVQISELESLIVAMKTVSPQEVSAGIAPDWTRELLQASHDSKQALDGEYFLSLDLSGFDFGAAVFKSCQFHKCQFLRTSFIGADLSLSHFIDCEISDANLTDACLDGAIFERCSMDRVQAHGADFNATYAEQCTLDGADFTGAKGQATQWVECSFLAARLQGVNWAGGRWQRCNLSGANVADAQLSKTQLRACELNGMAFCGADLQGASWSESQGIDIDLSNARLQQWQLDQGCRLPSVRLDGANLSNASLQHAFLNRASLRGACLSHALVLDCDLSDSDGYHVDASSADFTGTDLSRATWTGANLLEAGLRKVNLAQTDLRGSNLHGTLTEGVKGKGALFHGALMTRCRVLEDLSCD